MSYWKSQQKFRTQPPTMQKASHWEPPQMVRVFSLRSDLESASQPTRTNSGPVDHLWVLAESCTAGRMELSKHTHLNPRKVIQSGPRRGPARSDGLVITEGMRSGQEMTRKNNRGCRFASTSLQSRRSPGWKIEARGGWGKQTWSALELN